MESNEDYYVNLAQLPTISVATITGVTPGNVSISLQLAHKNLTQLNKKIARSVVTVCGDEISASSSSDVDATVVQQSHQPPRHHQATLVGAKDKRFVEVWRGLQQLKSFDVTDKHGDFCADDTFSAGLQWSQDGQHLAYVAEPAVKKHDLKTSEGLLESYKYEQAWGERHAKRSSTVLVSVDLATSQVTAHDQLDKSASQVVFGPGGKSLIYKTTEYEPRKHGIVYCHNRPGALWQLELADGTVKCLSAGQPNARSPRLSSCGKYVVYLSNDTGGGHYGCARLVKYEFATGVVSVIVDLVRKPADTDSFPGLYAENLPQDCWFAQDMLALTSQWRSRRVVLVVNTVTGKVSQFDRGNATESISVLACRDGVIVASASSCNAPACLLVGRWLSDALVWKNQLPLSDVSLTDDFHFEVMQFPSRNNDLEAVVLRNQSRSNGKLMLCPHGGPHSAFSTDFSVFSAAFCMQGYTVALVNYTGSVGYGQDAVDRLLGQIGTLDVQDVHHVALALNKYDSRLNQTWVFGGSHGGFIGGHLMGQWAQFYSGAILRNPVLNVGTNLIQSDIPDWSYLEAGVPYSYTKSAYPSPPPAVYDQLFRMSPVSHVSKVIRPVLFLLGAMDLRVPNYEALNWFHYLKSNGKPVECYMFPDDNHALEGVEADWASWCATRKFIERYGQ